MYIIMIWKYVARYQQQKKNDYNTTIIYRKQLWSIFIRFNCLTNKRKKSLLVILNENFMNLIQSLALFLSLSCFINSTRGWGSKRKTHKILFIAEDIFCLHWNIRFSQIMDQYSIENKLDYVRKMWVLIIIYQINKTHNHSVISETSDQIMMFLAKRENDWEILYQWELEIQPP